MSFKVLKTAVGNPIIIFNILKYLMNITFLSLLEVLEMTQTSICSRLKFSQLSIKIVVNVRIFLLMNIETVICNLLVVVQVTKPSTLWGSGHGEWRKGLWAVPAGLHRPVKTQPGSWEKRRRGLPHPRKPAVTHRGKGREAGTPRDCSVQRRGQGLLGSEPPA